MGCTKREKAEEEAFPWAELPSEVQNVVLGWLPLRSLFRSKRVCKLWNTTISSPSFAHFPSRLICSGNRPWLIFFTRKSFDFLLAFDFDRLSWFKFDASFLLTLLDAFHVPTSLSPLPSAHHGFVWCAGTASGLLLLDFHSSLLVCNPLTKSLVKLPQFKCIKVIITQGFSAIRNYDMQGFQMPADSRNKVTEQHICAAEMKGKVKDFSQDRCACLCAHGYTVVVIGKAKSELVIEAYCLNRNTWEIVGSMPTSFIIRHDQIIECDGVFHGLLLNPLGMLVIGESRDIGFASWRIQDLPVNYEKETCRLLACQNSIFMVCSCPIDVFNNGFVIWQYQTSLRSWIKMCDMPEYTLEQVRNMPNVNWVDCFGVGNFICFRALGTLKVLTYDICNESWSWLPEPSESYDTVFARGHQFEPRLDYTQYF